VKETHLGEKTGPLGVGGVLARDRNAPVVTSGEAGRSGVVKGPKTRENRMGVALLDNGGSRVTKKVLGMEEKG